MSGRRSLFTQVLDEGDAPLALYKYLAKKWAVPKYLQEFTASRSIGFPVLKDPGTLVLRDSEGINELSLLAVNKDGLVSVLHSLLQVGESDYKVGPGELLAIRSEIPADRLPVIVRLEAIHFAANSSFVGTSKLKFEIHLAGLNSCLPQDFEDNNHQPEVKEENNGVHLVKSRGLAFVPCATVDIPLEQGSRAPIIEAISHAFVVLRIQDRAYDPDLD